MSVTFLRSLRPVAIAALVMIAIGASPAAAEVIYWNGTASPGNVWSDVNAWSTTTGAVTPPPIAPPGASDDVVFNISTDNSPETVRLNGAQSALSILFRSTGTTTLLGGTDGTPADNTLTLGGGGITLQAGAGAVTIGSATSPGQVAVALAASQTWTNNSSSLFTVANGIARATGDTTNRTLTIAGSGNTTLAGTIANGGASGTLGLAKTGNGTLTLSGANTFTGATSISGGTLTLSGAAGGLGGTSGITLSRNATLTLSNTAAANNTNRIADAAGLTVTGGTFNFTHTAGAANYAETIAALSIAGGAFRANLSQAATSQTSAVTAASWARSAGGTALFSGTGLGVDNRNRFIFTATPTMTNAVLQGAVHQNGSTLSLATHGANGIVALGSTNTAEVSWTATINARPTADQTLAAARSVNSLVLDSGIDLNAPSADRTVTFTAGSGTILQTSGTSNINAGSSTNEYIFAFGSGQALFHVYGTLNFNRGNATNQITGTGGMVKAGTGTLALNVPSDMTGGFWINEGTVNLGNATALGATTNPVTVRAGTLNIGANNISIGPLAGGPTARINPNTTAGTRLITATFTTGTHEFAGTLTDNGSGILALTKAGDGGTLVLSGANAFTGNVQISGGTLRLTNQLALQNSTVSPGAAGTIAFDESVTGNAFTFGGLGGTGGLVLANNATTPAAIALTVGTNNATSSQTGVISGAGSIVKVGTGTLTLGGTSTYLGGTTISAGTLLASANAALGSGGVAITSTGRLQVGPGVDIANAVTYSGAWNTVGTGPVMGPASGTATISGPLTFTATAPAGGLVDGGTGLTLAGPITATGATNGEWSIHAGTVTLSGAAGNNYSALLATGTLNLGVANAIPAGATLWLARSGTTAFNLSTFDQTIANLTLGTHQVATINATTGILTVTGTVQNDAGSTATQVINGNLALPAGGTIFNIDSGATGSDVTVNAVVSGAGLTKTGLGILTLTGSNTYAGTAAVSAGTLAITTAAALPGFDTAGRWSVASGAMLGVTNGVGDADAASMLAAGNLSAGGWLGFDTTAASRTVGVNLTATAGGILKYGTNTLVLSGTNAVTGGFRTVAGTLQFNAPAATGAAGITVAGGSTSFAFDGTGSAAGSGGNGTGALQTIDFNSGVTVVGDGTLVVGRLAGYGSTYATAANKTAEFDTLSLGANTLTVTNSNGYGALFSGATTLTGTGTISVANATASNVVQGLTLSGPVGGASGLKKSGNGTLLLSNPGNTFTGNLAVAAGRLAATSDAALGDSANQVVLSDNAGLRAAGTFTSARTIQLATGTSTNVLEVVPGATFTLTSPFAGASATTKVTKADAGTLVLAGPGNVSWGGSITAPSLTTAQVLTGGLQIDQGAVRLDDDAALGAPANILAIGNLTGAAVQLTGGRTIPNPLVLNMGTANASAAGFYGGFGGLGVLQSLSGTNTWSGEISMNQDQGIGAAPGSTLNLTGGANLNVHILSLLGGGMINISTTPLTSVHSLYKLGSGTTNVTTSVAAPTSGGIRLYGGGGTMVFSGSGAVGTNTVNVEVYSGDTLVLDNSGTNVVNRLGGTSPTNLTNGVLRLVANGSAATSETMGQLRSFWGGNTIEVVTTAQNATLAFPSIDTDDVGSGSILAFRSGGTGANFGTPSNTVSFTTAPTLVSGLMPAAVVIDSAGTNFATYSSGSIRAFSTYATSNDLSTVAATATPRLTASAAAQTRTLNALAFGSTATLSAAAGTPTVSLTAGNILVQSGTATIASGVVVNSTTGTYDYALNVADGASLNVAGTLTNAYNVTKGLGGSLTFSARQYFNTGTNAFTLTGGTTTLAGGDHTLFSGQGVTANTQSFAIGSAATLDLGGTAQLVGYFRSPNNNSYAGSGGVITSATPAVFATRAINGTTENFGGRITGPVTYVQASTATNNRHFYADSTYTGATVITGGVLQLFDDARLSGTSAIALNYGRLYLSNRGTLDLADRLPDATPITLRGGGLDLYGRANGFTAETVGAVSLAAGFNMVNSATAGTGVRSTDLTLSSLTRPVGSAGVVRFSSVNGQIGSTNRTLIAAAPTLTNNIIGPWAIRDRELAGYVAGLGVGELRAAGFPGYDSTTLATGSNPTQNVRITASATLTGNTTVNALVTRAGAITIDLGGNTLGLTSGGLLLTTESDGTTQTLSNGTLTAGAAGVGGDLYLYWLPYGGTARVSAVSARVADNAGGPVRLVLSSSEAVATTHKTNLSGANVHTGGTVVNQGQWDLTGAASTVVIPAGGLTLNNAGMTMVTNAGQIAPTNVVTLEGGSALTLVGANTLAGVVFDNRGGTATPTLATGGVLTLNGNITASSMNVATMATITGTVNFANAARTITVNPVAVDGRTIGPWTPTLSLDGIVQNAGTLTVTGGGVLRLGAATSTFAGGYAIDPGTGLIVAESSTPSTVGATVTAGPLGTGTLTLGANSRLMASGTFIVANPVTALGSFMYDGNASLTVNGAFALPAAGTPTIDVPAPQGSLTIGGAISGAGTSLTKTGYGLLGLAGANTLDGGVTLSAGTLSLGNAAAFGSGPLTLAGGNLDSSVASLALSTNNAQTWSGNFQFVGTQSLNLGTGAVSLTGDRTVAVLANTLTVGGGIGDSGGNRSLTKLGAGTLFLGGASTYGGATAISAGTLVFGLRSSLANGVTANWTAANFTVASGATAVFDVGGTGEFTSADIGTIAALGTATGGFLGGSTLALDTVNAAGGTFTLAAPVADTNGGANQISFVKRGTGTLVLSAANPFTGPTSLAAGTLALANALALQNTTLTPAAVTSLVFDQSVAGNAFTVGAISGAVAVALQNNAATPAGITLSVGGNNSTTTYSGVLSGPGGITKTGTGSLTLSGTNTYLGTTTVTGGSIVVGGSAALGGTPAAATPGNIALDGGTLVTTAGPTIAANKGVALGAGGGTLIHGGSRFQIDGLIAGSGSLTISGTGAGDVNLTNANSTYSGGLTMLPGGRLPISNSSTPVSGTVTAGPLGTGTLTLAGGQIRAGYVANITLGNLVQITANSTFYSHSANTDRDLVFTGATTLVGGTRIFTIDTSVASGSTGIFFNNTVSDEGNGYGVTKAGAGTLVFGGTNDYSGTTTVSAGALRLGAANALPGGIGTTGGTSGLTLSGGVVDLAFDDFLRPLGTGAGAVQFTASGGFAASGAPRTVNFGGTAAPLTWGQANFVPDGSPLILSNSLATNTVTFVHPLALGAATRTVQVNNGTAATDAVLPAVISGTGGLTKTGNGTLALAAANTYAGTTTLTGGVASLASAEDAGTSGPLGNGGAITFSGGTLQFTATNTFDYIPRITGSGSAIQLDTNSQNVTLAGSIAGTNTAGLTKRGEGTLTLSGTNAYGGTTTVVAGTLSVAANANLGAGTAISLGGGRLTITGESPFASARNVTLTASSEFEVANTAGASIGTLTGAFTLTKLGNGSLAVNGATNSLTALNLNGGSLELGAASNLTLSNAGGNSLQSTVGGTISGGSLTLGANGDNWGTANGTTLTIASRITGVAANGFESFATSNGTGVMVLANPANDFLGNVTINSGTVSVATINNAGVASHLGAGNAAGTISISSSNTSTGRLTYTGTGSTTNRVVNLSGTTSGATIEQAGTGLLKFTSAFAATGAGSKTLTLTGSASGIGEVGGAIVNNSSTHTTALTKTGTGRWVLSGASTYTGNTNVHFGILQYSTGATTTTPRLSVGYGAGRAAGVIQDSGVSLSIATATGGDVLSLGGTGGYGYYLNNGGTLAVGQLGLVGNSAGAGSTAVFEQNGGSTAVSQNVSNGWILFGWTGTDTNGVLNIRNGAVYNGSTTNNTTMGFIASANSMGMLNLLGPGAVMDATGGGTTPFSGTARGVQLAANTGNFGGWLNLNGGTLTTNFVRAANAGTPSFLGLDGGTLRAKSATTTFVSGLTDARVYSGGATIDTNGVAVTIPQPLLAPSGSGVTSIPVSEGGSGYVGAPAVRLSGGGGSGASAVAVVDLDPVSPTFGRVTAIQVTSAGSGYTSPPSVTLLGGGPATAATLGPAVTAAVASGGLVKTGAGTLTLSGANTFTGGFTLGAGTVSLGVAQNGTTSGPLGASGTITLGGGVLQYSAANVADYSARFSTAAAQAYNVDTNGQTVAWAAPLSSPSGTLAKSGLGTLVLEGQATFSGGTTVSAGVLRIGTGGGLSDTGAVTISGGTLDVAAADQTVGAVTLSSGSIMGSGGVRTATGYTVDNASGTTVSAAVLAGAGGLTKSNAGRLILSGASTYAGTSTLAGGIVNLGVAQVGITSGPLGGSGPIVLSGGTLQYSAANATDYSARFSDAASQAFNVDTGGRTVIWASPFASAGGTLQKFGSGTLTLTGASTFDGGTTVAAGTLQVGDGITGSLNGTTGTPLAFTGSGRFAVARAADTTQGMGSLTLTSGNGVVESTWAGTGVSTLAFSSLAARGAAATGNFVTTGGTNGTGNRITLTGQATGFIDQRLFYGGNAFAWYDAAGFVRGLAYDGTEGTTTAGGTSITGTHVQVTGAVTAQTTGTFSTLAFTTNSAFTLAATQTVTVNGLLKSGGTAGGTISGGSGIRAASGQALVVRTDAAADTLTIGTPVLANGASSLVKTGAGTLTLNATAVNTFTGGTFLNEGVLVAAQDSNFGSTAANNPITFNGGTLRASAAITLNANHGLVVGPAGGEINGTSSANTITLASANMLSGTGVLRLTGDSGGSSVLLVSGTNAAFTGGIEIASGRLQSDTASATNPLGTGDITVGAGNSSLWINGGTSTFGNRFLIQGNGGETRGVIRLTGGGTTISGPIELTGNASLIADAAVTTTFNGPISGGFGAFFGSQTTGMETNASTTAVYVVNGYNSQAATRIGAGVLAINSDRALGLPNAPLTIGSGTLRANATDIVLSSARTVTLNAGTTSFIDTNANALRIDGPIAATSGSLTKVGTGTLTLAGAVGHTGATTINAGSLVVSGTPATGTALTLGAGTAAVRAEYAGVDATYGSLTVPSNSPSFNELSISSGRTLTINGNVSIGVNADGANTRLRGVGGGSVVVSGSAANFSLGGATGETNENPVTVDFSALASFTANLGTGTFRMGDLNTSTTGNATSFTLATSNAITAGLVQVGDGSGGNSTHTLTLGSGTNQINSGTINVGSAGGRRRSSGQIVFGASDTTGTIRIRAADGVGRATINLVNSSGDTGSGMSGTLDFAGHAADILAGTMTMATRSANIGAATGTFTFDQGTFDVTTLAMAQRTGAGTGGATATVSLGGGTSTIGSLTMAVNTSAGGTSTGTFNVSGGSVTIGTGSGTAINMANATTGRTAVSNLNVSGGSVSLLGNLIRTGGAGTETATIALSGGTLDLGNYAIGSGTAPISLTATGGTLRNVLSLNGTGGLTKTGTGLLRLEGTNAWTGGVTLSAGTLEAATAAGLGTGNVSVASGAVLRLFETPGLGVGNRISLPTGAGLVVASGVAAPLTEFSNLAGWSILPSGGRGTVGDILSGTVLAGGTTLTSAWDTGSLLDEQYSDVLSLSGTGAGNPFVLALSYQTSTPAGILPFLNVWRRSGGSGPFAPIGTSFAGVGVPWTSGFTTVGQYGVDTTSQTVWVVSDTNSQFVIVPEPATLALVATAAAGIGLALRRRLRSAA